MSTGADRSRNRSPEQLQERLLSFAAAVCESGRQLRRDVVTTHMLGQLARCATSAAANYAEARAGESRRDFVHKMQVCLKELRETGVWLELLHRLDGADGLGGLKGECDQLTAIFVSSIKTARRSMWTNG